MNRDKLARVYNDLQNKYAYGRYGRFQPQRSTIYSSEDFIGMPLEKKYKTVIDVYPEDVLVVAEKYVDRINKVLVLNLASARHPGGGVERGAMAQEEELFRRTLYFTSLKRNLYPIQVTTNILTPDILVVKDDNYMDLEKPFSVSMLAAAAIRYDKRIVSYKPHDRAIMQETIMNIFRTAYKNGYDTLILGALGCGAFKNPTHQVVELYNEAIAKFNGCFKYIAFAVLDSRHDDNFDQFNELIVR